jgi:hypothetical protein
MLSPNGCFKLVMQFDQDLVLYRVSDKKVLWSAGTKDKNTDVVCMNSDGNLVIYVKGGGGIWTSKTNGLTGASLTLKNDGNLVVSTDPTNSANIGWQTDTQYPCTGKVIYQS